MKRFKSNFIFWIALAVAVGYGALHFAQSYLKDSALSFTEEDKFILLLFLFGVMITAVVLIYLAVQSHQMRKILDMIMGVLRSSYDENVKLHRLSQILIVEKEDVDDEKS